MVDAARRLPGARVFRTTRNLRIVACRSSSPEEKTLPRCLLTVRTSTSNSSAISFCVSQTASSS